MASFRLNKQCFNSALYSRVYDVWFGGLPAGATIPNQELLKKWFAVGASADDRAQFDSICHSNCHAALASIGPTAYPLPPVPQTWDAEVQQTDALAAPFLSELRDASGLDADKAGYASTALSMILLLDQMPRNIFRNDQAVIYSHYDRLSRAVLRSLLRQTPRADLHPSVRYRPALRQWFYLPLMHSEQLEDHAKFSELMAEAKQDVASKGDAEAEKYLAMNEDFETKHVVLLQRFGRYPHRNKQLGREMTEEETAFLESGGDSFGTGA